MVITLDWTVLQVALILSIALVGITMGWKYMALWTIGIFFATLASDAIGPRIERLVNRFLSIGAAFANDFLTDPESPTTTVTPPTVEIASPDLPLWQIGFLLLVAVPIALFVARSYGNRINVGLIGRITGGIFGALGGIILLGKLTEYWRQWVTAPGHTDPLANFNIRYVPSTPTIVFGGPSTGGISWETLAGLAIILAIALLIFYAFYRVLRIIF
jgi:hypothetical protein